MLTILRTLFIFIVCSSAYASSVSVPLRVNNLSKKPAQDLIHQGKRIDAYEAFDLKKTGIDLSNLNPYESHLWQNKKHLLNVIKIPPQSYRFSAYKTSPTEFFKAVVIGENNQRYVITASLKNHMNVVRASLLRLLGYDIDIPRYYKKLSINFDTKKEKDLFIATVGEKTLTKRSKWVDESSNDTTLILKDVTLENAKLRNVNIYMPVMLRARQQDRRVFRSLLSVYAITEFKQSINATTWKVGRVFDENLMITIPYANQFRDVSKEDLLWIQKRLNNLSLTELKKAVSLAMLPKEIESLVLNKLISRINSLNDHLGLTSTLSFDRYINSSDLKTVQDGKLTREIKGRVVDYYNEDAESPYKFKDLFRLYRSQAVYNLLSRTLDEAINKFVPGLRIGDAANEIQEQIADFRANNTTGILPIKAFAYPTAYAGAAANRNIVFGQQFGRSAPIQLVDTVSANANLGVFSMLTGISDKVMPSLSAQVGLARTYTHVRPMPDLQTATSQTLKKILVPKLMKNLGQIIELDIVCSLDQDVNIVEETLRGERIIYIKYDKAVDSAKELAIKKRSELIADGIPENIILLVGINKEEECIKEIDEKKSKNLDTFLKEFALNETFIITDSVNLTKSASANIPLETISGIPLNLSASGDMARGMLRNITLRKAENNLEVTIQMQNNTNKSLGLNLNFFIDILAGTKKWLKGKQKTLLYKIPIENLTKEKRNIVSKILHDLFTSNSLFTLKEHYAPLTLLHDVSGNINTIQYLWFKSENMRLNNFVEIVLPEENYPGLTKSQRSKKLYSTSSYRRNGRDIFGFFNNLVNRFSSLIRLGQNPADAGQAIKGSSRSRYYTTEGDISENVSTVATTKIEYLWKGWKAKNKKLNHMFNFIESLFDKTQLDYTIDRSDFQDKGVLRGYEVRMTIIVYPEFYETFKQQIIKAPFKQAARGLRYLYGPRKWDWYCEDSERTIHNTDDESMCMPHSVRKLLKFRKTGLPNDKVKLVKAYNSILLNLMEGYDRKKVLKWISKRNMFSSTRVTGFKEGTEKGYVDYISNTYGQYNREYGTGIFDQIGALLGIAPFELRALNYTPGL